MRKDIKNFGKFINENSEKEENFEVGDMVLYNYKYVAKIMMIHEGYELLRIKIYHTSLTTTTTDVSSTLCEKFHE